MDTRSLLKGLHPLEIKTLLHYSPGESLDSARLVADLGFVEGQANQAQAWLIAKSLGAETGRSSRAVYEMTALGRSWLEQGTPEERLVRHIAASGPSAMPAICAAIGLEQKDAGSAFGRLSKSGVLAMSPEKLVALADPSKDTRSPLVRGLLAKAVAKPDGVLDEAELDAAERAVMAEIAKKRGSGDAAFRTSDRETVSWVLGPEAAEVVQLLRQEGVSGDEASALTQEMLENGRW